MSDIGTGPLTLPIGGADRQFARITLEELLAMVEWANSRVIKAGLDALPENTSPRERAQMIRAIGKAYDLADLPELLEDPDCVIHLLWRSYEGANAGTSKSDFLRLFELTNIAEAQSWVDVLAGFAPDKVEQDGGTEAAELLSDPQLAAVKRSGRRSAG